MRIIAVSGNPNVGKSTVFNALTGLKQHTGNWPGKTVASACGNYFYNKKGYTLVDLPGTYSLMANSVEEEITRDYILSDVAKSVVVVCDATCLERNLNLVLQILEITPNVVVCVNLMDEAKKKKVEVDLDKLSDFLNVPVVACTARSKKGIDCLLSKVEYLCDNPKTEVFKIKYPKEIEIAIEKIIELQGDKSYKARYYALKILADVNFGLSDEIDKILTDLYKQLAEKPSDIIASSIVLMAEGIGNEVVSAPKHCNKKDRKIDKYLTGKLTGIPIMVLLLFLVLWITITGANYPSKLLSDFLFMIEDRITEIFVYYNAPDWLYGSLVLGVYRVLAWVVSVMLPPMAIFFPLFTLLEDFGYLPRVAFNLDSKFKSSGACGKQALTMCMGLGCNAAGVIGCRIIDSPRERLIAIITNNFIPCNGRFPTLIAIITMFFVGTFGEPLNGILSSMLLCGVIILGIILTFAVSKFLSATFLKGVPSSFTLELPPYRVPQIGRVIVTSLFDRTLFVLGRAIAVAAPAGLFIWAAANIFIGDQSILMLCAEFLNPFAEFLGMDGVILIAFLLGLPANEIVVPIIIMAYACTGKIVDFENLSALKELLLNNGWTWATAVSVMLFSLCHFPCSTTCLTIKKETGSLKWTALSIVIPTVIGLAICFVFTSVVKIFGLV
ncbi:MAG: ferrous iron transport protein B [Oscillospiraceae bacterium]